MDFAKKLLKKYGWKEGDGLGKNNDGIAKPLRANLKFDNAGLGSDIAEGDFNNHWWERVFNEAASNVAIESESDGVYMNLKNPNETVEITTKGYSVRKLKYKSKSIGNKADYDNFLQSATLSKAGTTIDNPNKIPADDIDCKKFKQLTDEELFKACGGRTAHKGARHGLKLSGKLSRLELQEKELLAKMQAAKHNALETVAPKNKPNKKDNQQAEEYIDKNKIKRKKLRDDLRQGESNKVECEKTQAKVSHTNELITRLKYTDALELPKKKKKKNDETTMIESAEVITEKSNEEEKESTNHIVKKKKRRTK